MYADDNSCLGLWQEYQATHSTYVRDKLIVKYCFLSVKVANFLRARFSGYMDYDDLVGFATIGLINAIERFDPSRGLKFENYAVWLIKNSVIDKIRKLDWVPRAEREKSKQAGEASIPHIISLEDYLEKNHDISENSATCSSENQCPEQNAERQEIRGILDKALDKLSPKEKEMIGLYYFKGLTFKEIGKKINVSESRVSQIHSKAIIKLKFRLKMHKSLLTG